MPIKMPATDESALNMTPMIDITFQLIVFFMLNMRFKSLEWRIDSALPKDRGLAATPQFVEDIPNIKVALFRENEEDKSRAYTKIKVGGQTFPLPITNYTGTGAADEAMDAQREKVFVQVTAKIREMWTKPELKGEIEAPPPKGAAVPHGDIIKILDAFLEVGISTVNFVGTAAPLPKKAGGVGAG